MNEGVRLPAWMLKGNGLSSLPSCKIGPPADRPIVAEPPVEALTIVHVQMLSCRYEACCVAIKPKIKWGQYKGPTVPDTCPVITT